MPAPPGASWAWSRYLPCSTAPTRGSGGSGGEASTPLEITTNPETTCRSGAPRRAHLHAAQELPLVALLLEDEAVVVVDAPVAVARVGRELERAVEEHLDLGARARDLDVAILDLVAHRLDALELVRQHLPQAVVPVVVVRARRARVLEVPVGREHEQAIDVAREQPLPILLDGLDDLSVLLAPLDGRAREVIRVRASTPEESAAERDEQPEPPQADNGARRPRRGGPIGESSGWHACSAN